MLRACRVHHFVSSLEADLDLLRVFSDHEIVGDALDLGRVLERSAHLHDIRAMEQSTSFSPDCTRSDALNSTSCRLELAQARLAQGSH